ncbi:MAG: lytic transglycosylase F [Geminicoccaceae bacterium]
METPATTGSLVAMTRRGFGRRLLAAAAVPALPVTDASPDEDPLLAAALHPWKGDLPAILERGMLRVAIPVGLSTYILDGPDQKGITYDRVVALEQHLKRHLGRKARDLTVVVIPAGRDRVFAMLDEGRADLAAGNFTITRSREARVAFTAPFRENVREVIVTGPDSPAIANFSDMVGVPIHVRKSSSFHEHLTLLNRQRQAAGKAPLRIVAADENLHTEDLVQMVAAGLIPATAADEPWADLFAGIFPAAEVRKDLALAEGQRTAWALRKGDRHLRRAVDAYVATARVGTKLGNILVGRYLKDTGWAEDALDPDGRQRFVEMARLLRTFARRYDFDWLMIAAQGYQESRLDQSVRSPAGAIGVMQVLPSTARDPNVAIDHIDRLENNIHAGVRYLRFLRDRYFADPGIGPLDRTMLAFAAYNAGPAAIARARRKAATLGLDPDVWFDNVEIAAARAVSHQPVVYCRNIFKYYIAYRLSLQPQAV